MISIRTLFFIAVIFCSVKIQAQSITYISPVPNSQFNSRETNIILRSAEKIAESTLSADDIRIDGSVSGSHAGSFILSDDQQTLLFHSKNIFSPSEEITVLFNGEVKTVTGKILETKNFSFTITSQSEPLSRKISVNDRGEIVPVNALSKKSEVPKQTMLSVDSLPSDLPKYKLDTTNNPAPGYYLLATVETVPSVGHYLMMFDNNGKVVKYKHVNHHAYDFKVQPNGLMSYGDPFSEWGYAGGSRVVHRVLDSTFTEVDSFRAGNGYDADSHAFLMLPNGHVLIHAYDIQYFDLRNVVTGGSPNAIVVGSILQELDLQKRVVFQWRSWDYIPISETYMNATASAFDYIHINAYDIDSDGNILVCFRNTCDIVKINRMTGEIMWRMGGKKNEFTFIGENETNKPAYYTFQHSFNRLPNGNFLLFDNGNLHKTVFSRAVEYKIDQINKTATMVWEFRHTPDVFAPARGSAQRLSNGNTVIGWGSASWAGVGSTTITEVTPEKNTVFEMSSLDKMPSFSARKFVWNAHTVPSQSVTHYEVLPGNEYIFNKEDSIHTGITIKFIDATTGYNSVSVNTFMYSPINTSFVELAPVVRPQRIVISQTGITSFTADITFDSTILANYSNLNNAVVFGREFEGNGVFIPLTTVYDAVKKTVTINSTHFGEFIIGIPDQITVPKTPILVLPLNNARVNQTKPMLIRWSSFGHIIGSHLQIAKDSTFSTIVYNDSLLLTAYKIWNNFEQNTKYYWRSKTMNEQGNGNWSAVGTFVTSNVYITMHYPTAKEKFVQNSSYVLLYENNFDERVNIRLYKNDALILKIKDSTENTGRYIWKVPASGLSVDSTYTIKISSVLDSNVIAVSPVFSISTATGVVETGTIAREFALFQNYPNPFNPNTVISYQLPVNSFTTLKVYDAIGREVAILVNETKEAGTHFIQFKGEHVPSGMYFCRMQAGSFVSVKKILLLK
ncbi:MAG: aryl-sulfate sulfotransferase [Bacteroidota bacterium]|nr:aryl-sulfate sulfotransferase [Bacteroidota bacterium]